MKTGLLRVLWVPLTMGILYLTAASFRPLLPIDETRYMTVAWEMLLHHGWLQPLTLNFEPYHHKPPLLFWLINLSWSIFGVSRWAGLIPIVLISGANILLTMKLARLLFPRIPDSGLRAGLLMAGSFPFMVYGTLVMFDMAVCLLTLAALIMLVLHARDRRRQRYLVLMGLFTGLGVLVKGPVAYLYILFPMLLAPWWIGDFTNPAVWFRGVALMIAISILPVLFWLIPILQQADGDFAYWLVWNQTAGRMIGNFDDAHLRPIYFYLPLLPIMIIPWIFFPVFWRSWGQLKISLKDEEGMRFIACWLLPALVCFSVFSGKQPHYLVPLMPGFAMILLISLRQMPSKTLAYTFSIIMSVFVLGQIPASQNIFKRYDLTQVATYMQSHAEHPWAHVRNYHGELGFMARLEQPIADLEFKDLPDWFMRNPDGLAVIRYDRPDSVEKYVKLFDQPYRGKRLGIFSKMEDPTGP